MLLSKMQVNLCKSIFLYDGNYNISYEKVHYQVQVTIFHIRFVSSGTCQLELFKGMLSAIIFSGISGKNLTFPDPDIIINNLLGRLVVLIAIFLQIF